MKEFDNILHNLEISEEQVLEGKVLDAFESLQALKEKYNLCDDEERMMHFENC